MFPSRKDGGSGLRKGSPGKRRECKNRWETGRTQPEEKQGATLRKLGMDRIWCGKRGERLAKKTGQSTGALSLLRNDGFVLSKVLKQGSHKIGSAFEKNYSESASVEKGRQETVCLSGSGDQQSNAIPENTT